MFFIGDQFFPAFMMQVSATHKAACPVVGASGAFFILE